jgi:hypothetical protein
MYRILGTQADTVLYDQVCDFMNNKEHSGETRTIAKQSWPHVIINTLYPDKQRALPLGAAARTLLHRIFICAQTPCP